MARDTTNTNMTNNTARGMNVLLGAWLFISSFVWLHSASQFWNTLIVGAIVAVVALASFRMATLRFVNSVAAVWLFFSIWAIPTLSTATAWNNGIVAVGVFVLSLLGTYRVAGERRRTTTTTRDRPLRI